MKNFKYKIALLAAGMMALTPILDSRAQNTTGMQPTPGQVVYSFPSDLNTNRGPGMASATAQATASAPTLREGQPTPLSTDLNGALRVFGSTSITGFTPNGNYASLTASASSGSVALPSGATVQLQNAGTTAVSCLLGVGSATAVANKLIIQAGSSKSIVVGSNTFAGCIDQTGSASNLVVLVGGTGLGLDSGGGGGSSGGGASTIADGADVTLGAIADAAWSGSGSGTLIAVSKYIGAKVEAVRALLAGTLTVSGTVATTVADGTNVTIGAKADAKSTATDTTSITVMSVLKQISASVQAAASSLAGTLTVGTHAVTQSGTWTVQPGNTANTTAWKVDGSAVTQPVSGSVTTTPSAVTPLTSNAATSKVLKASAGTFYGAVAVNYAATAGFLIVYNATAAPAPGALAAGLVLGCVPLPSSSIASFSYSGLPGATFSTGITLLVSSGDDCVTYTTGVITAYLTGQAS